MSKLAKTQPTDVAAQLPAHLDTSGAAAMVAARAEVEARFLMAERHPRNWPTVRTRVLESCDRPRFAAGAMYAVPVGGGNLAANKLRALMGHYPYAVCDDGGVVSHHKGRLLLPKALPRAVEQPAPWEESDETDRSNI